jgi:hypothetical protein
VHRYLRFTAGSKDVVSPCGIIWNWGTQATMTMHAMRCEEEAYGLYYFLIQVKNYFAIHSPEFFSAFFFAQWELLHRSIGGSLWELCISSTSLYY